MGGRVRRSGWVIGASVAVLMIGGLTGCGGGDNTTTSPAKASFLASGNAICAKALQRLNAANQQAFGNQQGSPPSVTSFVESTLVPNVQSQVDQLRALKPPPGDEATVKKILDAAQVDVDSAKQDPAQLANNEPVFHDATQLAADYGLTACGSGHFF
jgi:hypothetical protein